MFAAQAGTTPNSTIYVDDVFSTYLYTGNGGTQTITNGIDLAGKGGLVWLKKRNSATNSNHQFTDTVRGVGKPLLSNSTAAEQPFSSTYLSAFSSSGFSLGNDLNYNNSGDTFVSWTFRKSAKFFDVVTYTGNGSVRAIAHSLGIAPGLIVIKPVDSTGDWMVYHRSVGNTAAAYLNTTATPFTSSTWFNNTSPTSSDFTIGTSTSVNAVGTTYVAYLFAHDPDTTSGIIQAGSFTTPSSGYGTINLGWEPQWLLVKSTGAAQNWHIMDFQRGLNSSDSVALFPNLSNAEATGYAARITATGFQIDSSFFGASRDFIYLAIRRPNKPPTSGTQIYNAIARTGTGAAATVTGVGFAPDLAITSRRSTSAGHPIANRLTGIHNYCQTQLTDAETDGGANLYDLLTMDGVTLGTDAKVNPSGETLIHHFFKRAVGVFDVVAYTGDGTANRAISHNLGVAPELIIAKSRTAIGTYWRVLWSGSLSNSLNLNGTSSWADLAGNAPYFFGNGTTSGSATAPTATSFYVANETNASSQNIIAYLFATKAGISKVGSFTGNGTSQTINCGFASGARFVLIKRTDSTGDWYVWDTVRGIIAANDPHLSLNTTAAEVTTDDSIDPDSSGFIVNQVAATNTNVNAATYIYLAIA